MESFNRKRSDESTSIQLKLRRSLSIQKQGDLVLYWDFVKHRIQRFTLTCLIELKNTSNRKALLRQSLYSGFFFFFFIFASHIPTLRGWSAGFIFLNNTMSSVSSPFPEKHYRIRK